MIWFTWSILEYLTQILQVPKQYGQYLRVGEVKFVEDSA